MLTSASIPVLKPSLSSPRLFTFYPFSSAVSPLQLSLTTTLLAGLPLVSNIDGTVRSKQLNHLTYMVSHQSFYFVRINHISANMVLKARAMSSSYPSVLQPAQDGHSEGTLKILVANNSLSIKEVTTQGSSLYFPSAFSSSGFREAQGLILSWKFSGFTTIFANLFSKNQHCMTLEFPLCRSGSLENKLNV